MSGDLGALAAGARPFLAVGLAVIVAIALYDRTTSGGDGLLALAVPAPVVCSIAYLPRLRRAIVPTLCAWAVTFGLVAAVIVYAASQGS